MSGNEDAGLRKEAVQTNAELQNLSNEVDELQLDATAHDIRDMDALGLAPVFKRRFKFVAMVGFCSTVVVAWQNTLTNFGFGLYDGGYWRHLLDLHLFLDSLGIFVPFVV